MVVCLVITHLHRPCLIEDVGNASGLSFTISSRCSSFEINLSFTFLDQPISRYSSRSLIVFQQFS